jgi:hypothetical protein
MRKAAVWVTGALAALLLSGRTEAAPCDAALALSDSDPVHGAAAIDLCTISDGSSEGLVSAAYGNADFSFDAFGWSSRSVTGPSTQIAVPEPDEAALAIAASSGLMLAERRRRARPFLSFNPKEIRTP